MNCSAGDVSINTITVASGAPASCVGGQTLPINLNVTVQFGAPTRYNIGVFIASDGNNPQFLPASGGAAACTVSVLPNTSPFLNLDGGSCGDGDGTINGNTGAGTFTMTNVAVPCTTDGSGNATLNIPYLVSWDQSGAPNACFDNTYPAPGTKSKCNTGSVNFPPGTTIVVLPAISVTDGVATVRSGSALTYTVVITNTTASPLAVGALFTDPAVADLSISSVSCSAAGGATCPASPAVAQMQGSGIVLPAMPNNSSLTFTVVGTYTGTPTSPTTLINTASISVSGYTNSVSDTDTVMVPPTVVKSFSPSAIASGGTSTLTIRLTNPTTTVNITGAAFSDNYPAGMTNKSTPALTNTCGGTATAAANGTSLSLSGATIPQGSSCTVTVQVTATTTGVNSTGAVTSGNAATGSAASATLSVVIGGAPSTVVANPTTVLNDGVATSTITVTLKDTAGNPVPGKTITLTAGSGSSTITTVSGVTNVSGQATFTVKDTVAESVTYTAKNTTDNITLTQTATVIFSAAAVVSSFNAFETSTGAGAITGKIFTKLAGVGPFWLDVVAISGGAQSAGFSNNVKVEMLANAGTAGSGYGADNCPTSSTVLQTIASTPIAGGRSTVSFPAVATASRDVRVRISYPTGAPTVTSCSNDSFAIRPQSITVTSSNANADVTGTSTFATPVIKAGSAFALTATAVAGYSTTPVIDASKASAHAGAAANGVPAGSFGAANPVSGVASGASFTYTEVGYFRLSSNGVYDDQFTTAVDASPADCTADFSNTLVGGKYGCKFGNTSATNYFGRFVPDHFETIVTGPMSCGALPFAPACPAGGLVYSGQPFTTTVTAYRLGGTGAGGITQNYAGSFAPGVTLTAWDAAGGATLNPPAGGGALTGNSVAAGSFAAGVATTMTPVYTFTAIPTNPTNIYIRATDADFATSLNPIPASSVEGGVKVVSGRLRLQNAYGSERLPLVVPAEVQYYDGTNWLTNTQDSSSTSSWSVFPPGSNALDGINAVGNTAGTLGSSLVSGITTLTASAPGSAGFGYKDLTVVVPAFLKFPWAGCAIPAACTPAEYLDPTARVSFGIYKGNNRIIYRRERY